jgi:hypothetical protein
MFLACENLAEGKGKASNIAPAPASNAAIAAAFRQQVEDLSRVSPDLSEWDVAKLVELLADRDITRGGKEIKP